MAPRAIITGAAGLIGQYLVKSAPRWAPGWTVEGIARPQLDLTDQPLPPFNDTIPTSSFIVRH